MGKNGRIAGLIALALALTVGIVIWVNREDGPADGPARLVDRDDPQRRGRGSLGFGSGDSEREATAPNARRAADDAGVPRVAPPIPSGRTALPIAELPPGANGAERSAGWRLGQTRHNISIVEPRVARMEQQVRDFEARGDTAAADQQRTILERFQNRLSELRAEETELEAQARRDGTSGEEQQGYDEGADERQRERGAARVGPPTP